MKCNYDEWTTKPPKKATTKMLAVLKVMQYKMPYTRCDLLRLANIDPNSKSKNGFANFEKTDYFLYKAGLIEYVGMQGSEKMFVISDTGVEILS